MIRLARFFNSRNRRTPLYTIPLRFPGQPAGERIRLLRSHQADSLVLPSCLSILALYEWWRWLFSAPPNPLLLTLVAAAALAQMWRRQKAYKAELSSLPTDRQAAAGSRQVIELIGSGAQHLWQTVRDQLSREVITPLARWIGQLSKFMRYTGLSRLLPPTILSAVSSSLKRNTIWLNR